MMKWVPGLVLAGVAGYVAFAVSTGRVVPVVGGGKAAFWTMAALGFAVCAPGIKAAIDGGGFTGPLFIVGTLLGVAAMLVAGAVATGLRPAFLATDAQAIVAVAAVIVIKVAIATTNAVVSAG